MRTNPQNLPLQPHRWIQIPAAKDATPSVTRSQNVKLTALITEYGLPPWLDNTTFEFLRDVMGGHIWELVVYHWVELELDALF